MTSKLTNLFRSKKRSEDIYDEDSDEDVEIVAEEIYEDDADEGESGHFKERMEDIAVHTPALNVMDEGNCDVKVLITPGCRKSKRHGGAIFYDGDDKNFKQEEKEMSNEVDDQGKHGDFRSNIERKQKKVERSLEEDNEIYDSDEHADIGSLEVVQKNEVKMSKKGQSKIKSPMKFISKQMDMLETNRKVVVAHIGMTSGKLRGRIKERAKDKDGRCEKDVKHNECMDVEELYDEDEGQNRGVNIEKAVTERQNINRGKEKTSLDDIKYDNVKKKGKKETKESNISVKNVSKSFEKFDKGSLKIIKKKVSSLTVQNKNAVKTNEDSVEGEEDVYDSDEHENDSATKLNDDHDNVESVEEQRLEERKKPFGNLKTSTKFLKKYIKKMEASRKVVGNRLEMTTGKIKGGVNDKGNQRTEVFEGDSIVVEGGEVDDIYDEDEKELDNEIPANKKKTIQSTIIKPQPSMPSKTKDIKKTDKDEEIYDDDEDLTTESKKYDVNEVDEIYDDDEKDIESISAMSTASKVSHEVGAVRHKVSLSSLSQGMNTKFRGLLKKSDKVSSCSTRKDILYKINDRKDVADSESESEESFDDAFSDESGHIKTYIQNMLIKISQKLENRSKKSSNDNENGMPTSLKVKEDKEIAGSIAVSDDIYDSDDHEKEPTKLDVEEDVRKVEGGDLDIKKTSIFSFKSSINFLNNRINMKETKATTKTIKDKLHTLNKGKEEVRKDDFFTEHNNIVPIKDEELYDDDEKESSDNVEEALSLEIPSVKQLKKVSKRGTKSVEIEKEECEEVYDDNEKDSTSISVASTMSQGALNTREKLDADATSKVWNNKINSMFNRSHKKSSIKSTESFENKVKNEGGELQSNESFDNTGIEEAMYLKSYLKKKLLFMSQRLGTKRQKSLKSNFKKGEDEVEASEDIYDSDEHENETIEECEVTNEYEPEGKIKNILRRKSSMRFLSKQMYMEETNMKVVKTPIGVTAGNIKGNGEMKESGKDEECNQITYEGKEPIEQILKDKRNPNNTEDPSPKEHRKNTKVQDNNKTNFLECTPLEPKVKEIREASEDVMTNCSTNVQKCLEPKLLKLSGKHGIEITKKNGPLRNSINFSSMNEEDIYDEEDQENTSLEIIDSSVANEAVESKEAGSNKKSNGNLIMPIRFIAKQVRLMEVGRKVVANRLEVTAERFKERVKEKRKQNDDIYDDDDNMEQEDEKLDEEIRKKSLANGKDKEVRDRDDEQHKGTTLKDDDNEIYDADVTDEVVEVANKKIKEKDEEIYDDDEEDGEKKLQKEEDCDDIYDDDEKDNISVSTVSVKSKVSHHKEYTKYKHSISSVSKDLNKKLKGLLKTSNKNLPNKSMKLSLPEEIESKDAKDSEEESEESFDDAFSDDSDNIKTYIHSKLLRIAQNLDKKRKMFIKEKEKGRRNIRKNEDSIEKSTNVGDDVYDSDDHEKEIQEENDNEEVPRVEKRDQECNKNSHFTVMTSKNFFNKQINMLETNRKMIVTRLGETAGRIRGNFEGKVRKADYIYDDDVNVDKHVDVNKFSDVHQAETNNPSKKDEEDDDLNEIYDEDEAVDNFQEVKKVKSKVKVKSEKNFIKEIERTVEVKNNPTVEGKKENLKMIENQEDEKNEDIYDDDEREDEVDTTSTNSKPSGSNKTINTPKKVSLYSVSKDLNKKLVSALKMSKKKNKDLTSFYDSELPEEIVSVFDETFDDPLSYDTRNLKGFFTKTPVSKTERIESKIKETLSNVISITEENDIYDIDEHVDQGPSKVPRSKDFVKVLENDKTEIKNKSQSKIKSPMKFLSKHYDMLETNMKIVATHNGKTSGKFSGRIKEGEKWNDDKCKEKVENNECVEEELYDDDEGENEAVTEEKVVAEGQHINEKKETTLEDMRYDDDRLKGRSETKGLNVSVKRVTNSLEKFNKRSTENKISLPFVQKKKAERRKEDSVVVNDDVYDSEEHDDAPTKDLDDDHVDDEVVEYQGTEGRKKSYGNLTRSMKFLNKHIRKMEASRKAAVNRLEITAEKFKDRIKDKGKQKTGVVEGVYIVDEVGEVEDIYDEDEQEVSIQEDRQVAPDRGSREGQHQGNEDLELNKEKNEPKEAPRTPRDVEGEEIYDEDEEVEDGCTKDKIVMSTPKTIKKKSKARVESRIKHAMVNEECMGVEDNTYDSDEHENTKTNVDIELFKHVDNQNIPKRKKFYFHFKSTKNLKVKPIKSTSKNIGKGSRDAENEKGNVYEGDEGTEEVAESSNLMKEDSSEEDESQQIQDVPSSSGKWNPREAENNEIYDADDCLNEGDVDQTESVRKKSNRTLNFLSKKIANLEFKAKELTINVSTKLLDKKGKVQEIENESRHEEISQEMTKENRDDGGDVYDSDDFPKEKFIQTVNVNDTPRNASKGLKCFKEEKNTISNQIKNKFLQFRGKSASLNDCNEDSDVEDRVEIPGRGSTTEIGDNVYESKSDDDLPKIDETQLETDTQGASTSPSTELMNGPQFNFVSIRDRIKRFEKPP